MASGSVSKGFQTITLLNSIDLDDITVTGLYSYLVTCTNTPTSGNAGNLLVINGNNFVTQVSFVGNDLYVRRKSKADGTWNAWAVK